MKIKEKNMKKSNIVFLISLFFCINLISQNDYYKYKDIPIKVVYNYYYSNTLNNKDKDLYIQIDEQKEYYNLEIKYRYTKLSYKVDKSYLDNSDSKLVILDSSNKKSNKVFLRYNLFVGLGRFQYLNLPINKTYMYAPNHEFFFI